MPWYFIVLLFFLNIAYGFSLLYLLFLIFFHPRKKRRFLFIPIPAGIFYSIKNKIVKQITDFFEDYLEANKNKIKSKKPKKLAKELSEKFVQLVKDKWFNLLPHFISTKVINFLGVISYHFMEELFCSFIPELTQRYMIKEKILDLLDQNNLIFIEQKAKLYLTKPIAIIGCIIGFIFGIFNVILVIIF